MEHNKKNKIIEIFKEISKSKSLSVDDAEVELEDYLIKTFHIGNYFYFIFYLPEQRIEFCSEGVSNVLGITPKEWGFGYAMENIHPDDLPRFIQNEDAATKIFHRIPFNKQKLYKVRYDYRIKNKLGEYRRILHQVITVQNDEDGSIIRTFCVYTDITDLKPDGKMKLSVIGLNGEPTYYDVQADGSYSSVELMLSQREIEVVHLLAQGLTTKEISHKLGVSTSTVNNHRRSMIKKCGVQSTSDIVQLGLEQGWL